MIRGGASTLWFAFCLAVAAPGQLVAQPEPLILEGCTDRGERPVESWEDPRLPFIARADSGREEPVIRVNPEIQSNSFLSDPTFSWLYYRECAHIWLRHPLESGPFGREIDRHQETEADCMAINWLCERHGYGDREIKLIMRDLESLEGEEWEELQIGPSRIPDLISCRYGATK